MRERASGWLATVWLHCILAVTATVATNLVKATAAAQAAESSALLASRYDGSDLTGGQPAWPPHGAPKAGVAQPPWPTSDDDSQIRIPAPPTAADSRLRVQAVQGASQEPPAPGGLISEIRLGVLAHDIGFLSQSRENGVDITAELLFVAPGFLDLIGSPRPHIGLAVNTVGDTSQIYGGLTWDWNFWGPLYVAGSLGLAVLFRESIALGARFLARHNVSLVYSHISNSELCDANDGLDTVGVNFGYVF